MVLVKHGFREDEVLAMNSTQLNSYLELMIGNPSGKDGNVSTQRYTNQRRRKKNS
jgi:hypothetical protein